MFEVLLYYRYVTVADPAAEQAAQLALCRRAGIMGRILIGAEGINGTLAGTPEAVSIYRNYMDHHPLFSGIEYKVDTATVMPFHKLKIKTRPEIVTLGESVDVTTTAPRVSPTELNDMLRSGNVVLFDARNNYESAIGRFRGAITPDIDLFSDLPAALDEYDDLKDKTVVTYCTGGIRCEKASALMKQRGFKNVYQLDGGIIKYAKQYPDGAFEGECFVFDERMKVAFDDQPQQLGHCLECGASTNLYRNCRVHACNKLILVCKNCQTDDSVCSASCRDELMRLNQRA